MLDIKQILLEHKVHFVTEGPNTKRGEISLSCPICKDDPSQHLGVDLNTGHWACWRNKKHSGKNIHRLLALLDIYVSDESSTILPRLINRTYFGTQELEVKTAAIVPKKLTKLPSEFIPIEEESLFTRPYLKYMATRGFTDPLRMCKDYGLCFSIGADKWSRRLIIPTWIGDEVTWTARHIGNSEWRYLSPSISEARNIKTCLWNYNELLKTEGNAIFLMEGPIDAIYIDSLFKDKRVRTTALFGLTIPDIQVTLLKKLCPNFNKVFIGLDQGTLSNSLQLMRKLEEFNPVPMRLPKKDFNEMTPDENKELLEKYLSA